MWSDCRAGRQDRPALLEKYSGKCNIQGWLATVATIAGSIGNGVIPKQVDLPPRDPEKPEESSLDHLPAAASPTKKRRWSSCSAPVCSPLLPVPAEQWCSCGSFTSTA